MNLKTVCRKTILPALLGAGICFAVLASSMPVRAASGATGDVVSLNVGGTVIMGVDGSGIPNAGGMVPSFPILINVNGNPNVVFSSGRLLDLTKPMVALTYDDGPKSANGNHIMDVLEQNNGRATFFLVGENVKANAAEVQRMAQDGMEIGNHSYDHRYYNKLGAAEIAAEISSCNAVIQETAGVTPVLTRLPGGNVTKTVRDTVSMPMIYWTNDTRDWETKSTKKTIDRVVGHVKDGDIVLMHEIHSSTVKAQDTIIPALVQQGYQLVTVSELAYYHNYGLTTGTQYKAFPAQ